MDLNRIEFLAGQDVTGWLSDVNFNTDGDDVATCESFLETVGGGEIRSTDWEADSELKNADEPTMAAYYAAVRERIEQVIKYGR